jgi:uncharacterized protein (TIGR00255 family)
MRSMTGYGRATTASDPARLPADPRVEPASSPELATWVVELRSVNHRALDLKIRSPESDAYCDNELSRLIRATIERGAITVTITPEGGVAAGGALDPARIRRVRAALEELRHAFGLAAPVDLATVAAFLNLELAQQGAGHAATRLRGEALWHVLRPAVERALEGLAATRAREGAALTADMQARLGRLSEIVTAIRGGLEAAPERFARRLHEKLAALQELPGYDRGRTAQEIALLADRLDVSEEIVRLGTHLAHLAELLGTETPVGRKLDFVLQEIGREINTLGSKAQDASVTGLVIEAKSELEKIREQAQNIE